MLKDNLSMLVAQMLAYTSLLYVICLIIMQLTKKASFENRGLYFAVALIFGGAYPYVNNLVNPILYFGTIFTIGILIYLIKNEINKKFMFIIEITSLNILVIELLLGRVFSSLFSMLYKNNCYSYYSYKVIIILNLIIIVAVMLVKDKASNQNIVKLMRVELNQNKKSKYYFSLLQCCFLFVFCWEIYLFNIFEVITLTHKIATFCFTLFTFGILILLSKNLLCYVIATMDADLDKNYKEDVNKFIQVLRAQKHDFNFHIESILGMIEAQNYSACKNYLSSMLIETKAIAEVMPLEEPAISALFNTMKEAASMKGIKLDYFIHYNMSKICCTVYDINKVLGNLIQNAMDEVEGNDTHDRWVEVTILKRRNYCIIRVLNPIEDTSIINDRLFTYGYSTKVNHSGIGLNTVKKIVTAYGGAVFPELEDNKVNFIIQIPLMD